MADLATEIRAFRARQTPEALQAIDALGGLALLYAEDLEEERIRADAAEARVKQLERELAEARRARGGRHG